jgi:hypothetical protein
VCTSEQDHSGDGIIGTVRCSARACNMRWLVADLSLMDVHSSECVRVAFTAGITPAAIPNRMCGRH